VRLEILVASSRGRLLCVRRPAGGRMAGLFEFPARELVADGEEPRLWPAALPRGIVPAPGEPLGVLGHTITHHRIRAEVRAARAGARLSAGARWAEPRELSRLALTGLARKVLPLVPGAAAAPGSGALR
jgi:adenine-specific DNA glycosylase